MTTTVPTAAGRPPAGVGPLVGALLNAPVHAPVLVALAVVLALAMVPTLAAMAFDERLVDGVGIWVKPLKFEAALALYAGTLAVFAAFVPERTRAARWFRAVVLAGSVAIVGEMVWIGGAAAAGVGSHFNVASPLMAHLYTLAGIGAVTLTSLTVVFGVLIARNGETGLRPALHLSIWLGLVSTFLLTLVTAGTMASGTGHLVGGDGTPAGGFPLFGWSRHAGDLRVPHFFATHAMHALPLAGVAALGFADDRAGRRFVLAAGGLYVLFVAYTFVEALSGRPFLPGFG